MKLKPEVLRSNPFETLFFQTINGYVYITSISIHKHTDTALITDFYFTLDTNARQSFNLSCFSVL